MVRVVDKSKVEPLPAWIERVIRLPAGSAAVPPDPPAGIDRRG
jgi:hypothetical protein